MSNYLKQHYQHLALIKRQKNLWMKQSVVFVVFLILMAFFWVDIVRAQSPYIWFAVTGLVVAVTVLWWFWTMRIISQLIAYSTSEIVILTEIIIEIKTVKEKIEELTGS